MQIKKPETIGMLCETYPTKVILCDRSPFLFVDKLNLISLFSNQPSDRNPKGTDLYVCENLPVFFFYFFETGDMHG